MHEQEMSYAMMEPAPAQSPWTTLLDHLERLLHALDRLEVAANPVLRPSEDSPANAVAPAPSSALDDRVRQLGYLVGRLNATIDRIDL